MAVSGVKTVASAGTAVALGDQAVNGAVAIKGLTTNTGLVYVGNDGNNDVDSTNGFSLFAGDVIILDHVSNLKEIYLDAAVNGQGVSWSLMAV